MEKRGLKEERRGGIIFYPSTPYGVSLWGFCLQWLGSELRWLGHGARHRCSSSPCGSSRIEFFSNLIISN